jgi:hypothetical protein
MSLKNSEMEGNGHQTHRVHTHAQSLMELETRHADLMAEKIKSTDFGTINVGQRFYDAADGQPSSKITIYTKIELEERTLHGGEKLILNAQYEEGKTFFDDDDDINLIIE